MPIEMKERLVTDEIKKLVPVLGRENANRLSKAYLLGDEDTRKRIFELLDVMKAAVFTDNKMKGSILMEPPPKETAIAGDLELGHVLYGKEKLYPLMIPEESLLTHIGIFGSSGYGKTNISYWLIKKLSERGIPVLVFDFSKRNYKDLLSTDLKDRIDIYTVGRDVVPFKFNPLKPPEGVLLSQWMKEFSSIFDHAYWLLGGGRHIILKAMDTVHEENKRPRLKDLKDWLSEYGSTSLPARERNWLATATRPLESLCFKELGKVFDCDNGFKPSDFFKEGRITVLELDALDTNDKTFFIEITLQWLRDWLLVGNKREELVGTIILEEAHHVLNREKANKIGSETVMDLIFREVRELGLGVIYIDQHPSMVSYPAMGNTSTHIYMNLGLDTKHSSDVLDASNMLGLDEDEGSYLRKLPIGHGFVLCRTKDFREPFLVEFNKVDLQKGSITDDFIMNHMAGRIEKLVEEGESIESQREPIREEPIEKKPVKPSLSELGDHEWRIMEIIGKGQASFASQIYKVMKVSGSVFNTKVKNLLDMGLVGRKQAKSGKNKMHCYFLTETGEQVFGSKFGSTVKEIEKDTREIIERFTLSGWAFNKEENSLVFQDENARQTKVRLETTQDREKILRDLDDSYYFICSSERIRNLVIQQSSRLSYERGKPMILFLSTIEKFDHSGSFDRIDIG